MRRYLDCVGAKNARPAGTIQEAADEELLTVTAGLELLTAYGNCLLLDGHC